MSELAFEHFDPEFELCNLDINGKPIKPRKKPGRKPNPPSPAQRKAQNRAAQRAFRERKRREMHDAETNIKKCLNMRDQAIKDAKKLQKKVDELRYENNYLKGQLLTLKIACTANKVNVPKFWDTGMRDKMGSDATTFSRTKDIPQSLEFFLNRNKTIVTLEAHESSPPPPPPAATATSPNDGNLFHHVSPTVSTATTFFSPSHSDGDAMFNSNSPLTQTAHDQPPSAFCFDDLTQAIQSAAQSDMDPLLMQYLLQPDILNDFMNQMKDVPPELWLSQVPPELAALIPQEIRNCLSQPHHTQQLHDSENLETTSSTSPSTTFNVDSPTIPSSFQPEIPVEDDFWVDIKNTTLSPTMSNKVYVAGPISPLDAVNQMRTMRDQNDNRYLLTPTELQRRVPHDPRIDLIPGPTMRDYMIIFQDFYNANELFNFLIESAMFIGGELGNPDCWFVPPQFISKYWFLCPNHRPTRPDNSVELAVFFAQKMIDSLKRRKEMYIMRDQHSEHFLPPSIKETIVEDEDDMDEDERSVYDGNHEGSLDLLVFNAINKDIPRIISPNVFTV